MKFPTAGHHDLRVRWELHTAVNRAVPVFSNLPALGSVGLMWPPDDPDVASGPAGVGFRTTHWSVVLEASGRGSEHSAAALEILCRCYWKPVYAFICRKGYSSHDAQDLTQGFFARFLEKNYLGHADAAKGRFRTYLLAAVSSFLSNEWSRRTALKRGGGQVTFSLDEVLSDDQPSLDVPDLRTPERIFEERWAETVIAQVLQQLKAEFDGAGRTGRFEALKVFLLEDKGTVSYAEVASRLGLTVVAVKSGIARLRQRFRELLRDAIAHTVEHPSEIDGEIRYLLEVLSG